MSTGEGNDDAHKGIRSDRPRNANDNKTYVYRRATAAAAASGVTINRLADSCFARRETWKNNRRGARPTKTDSARSLAILSCSSYRACVSGENRKEHARIATQISRRCKAGIIGELARVMFVATLKKTSLSVLILPRSNHRPHRFYR